MTVSRYKWTLDRWMVAIEAAMFDDQNDDQNIELLKTLTRGIIIPLAFPDVPIEVEQL